MTSYASRLFWLLPERLTVNADNLLAASASARVAPRNNASWPPCENEVIHLILFWQYRAVPSAALRAL